MADIKVKLVSQSDGKEFLIGKGKINNLSVLNESTSNPETFNYGLLSDSGNISFSDFDKTLSDAIINEDFNPKNCFVEIIFNNNVISRLAVDDGQYNLEDRSFSLSLKGKEIILEKKVLNGVSWGSKESLYLVLMTVLRQLGFSEADVREELSKEIVFGSNGEVCLISDLLKNIKTPNCYIESGPANQMLNDISGISSLHIKTDSSSYVNIESSRPNLSYSRQGEILSIENKNLISGLNVEIVKKENIDGVSFSESKFSSELGVDKYLVKTASIPDTFLEDNSDLINSGKHSFEDYPNHEFYFSDSGNYLIGRYYSNSGLDSSYIYLNMSAEPFYKVSAEGVSDSDSYKAECPTFENFESFVSYINENYDNQSVTNSSIYLAGLITGKEFTLKETTEYFFAVYTPFLTPEAGLNQTYFEFGANVELVSIEKASVNNSFGSTDNVFDFPSSTLLDNDATYKGEKLSKFISNSIISDYSKGIFTGSVDVSCEDYYNLNGEKKKSANSGQIISSGDVVSIKKINKMFGKDFYWKVNSSEFKYEGKPYCSIKFHEIKLGDEHSRPSGLYDENWNRIYSWQELVDNGYISVSKNKVESSVPEQINGYLQVDSSILSFGANAFNGCDLLTGIYIPYSVNFVGTTSLSYCPKLELIYVSNKNTKYHSENYNAILSDFTYYDDNGNIVNASVLEKGCASTVIPDNVYKIQTWAFQGSGIEKLLIPDSVERIENVAFQDCSSLKEIWFGDNVNLIASKAFHNCSSLERVSLPYSIKTIDSLAFWNCSSLKSIYLPKEATSVASSSNMYGILYGCPSDCLVYTNAKSENEIPSGWGTYWNYYDSSNKLSIVYDWTKEQHDALKFFVVESDTFVKLTAFTGDQSDIRLPSDVQIISNEVFVNNTNLEKVVLNENLKQINDSAFSGCSNLSEINFPSTLNYISSNAFKNCSGLTEIEINDNLRTIGSFAFSGCQGIKTVYIPTTVTTINSQIFNGCSDLIIFTDAVDADSVPSGWSSSWNYYTSFDECRTVYNISKEDYNSAVSLGYAVVGDEYVYYFGDDASTTVPSGVATIGAYAFENVDTLNSVTIPNTTTEIGEYAFNDCSYLTDVVFEETPTLTTINGWAFRYCSRLQNFDIPSSVTSIGSGAFSYCKALSSVTIPAGVTTIPYQAFNSCGLTEINIPSTVTSVARYAFEYCDKATKLTIPSSITKINDGTFCGCELLTSVEIPDSVTEIGYFAFGGCYALTDVTIGSGVTSIGTQVFSYTALNTITIKATTPPTLSGALPTSVSVVYIPAGTLEAYESATNWSALAGKFVEV